MLPLEETSALEGVYHRAVGDCCQQVRLLPKERAFRAIAQSIQGLAVILLLRCRLAVHVARRQRIEVEHGIRQVRVAIAKLHDFVTQTLLSQQALEGCFAFDIARAVLGGRGVVAGG